MKVPPDVAVALGSVVKDELAATPPTVYLTTSDPEAPVCPAVPPEPFPVALVVHWAFCAPQLLPVDAMLEYVAVPPYAASQ